ncbi:MAG: hypothetical protein KDD40_00490 [Bdellovibrionales bacterium]|nr:hypothetical protein [Bdellovibrionales bacterium]
MYKFRVLKLYFLAIILAVIQFGCRVNNKIESSTSASDPSLSEPEINPPENDDPSSLEFKGYQLVKAFGDSANSPSNQPKVKQVQIVWQPFGVLSADQQYVLYRTQVGSSHDFNQSGACLGVTSSTCIVCSSTQNYCIDTNVAAAPAKYNYVVTYKTGSNITVPDLVTQSYQEIEVQVPPDNMALVNRESVNYELCSLMGKSPDITNKNRCAYDGPGATPYASNHGSTPLTLDAGFYDFGYNLFVDRWEAACNWTRQLDGGMCGAGATAGDCVGGTPSNGVGNDGQVYYNYQTGTCYLKASGSWVGAQSLASGHAPLYTNAPISSAYPRPPIVQIGSRAGTKVCRAQVDANYGPKRLMRSREFIAAAAQKWVPNDPEVLTTTEINDIEMNVADGGCFTNDNWHETNTVLTITGFGSGDELAVNALESGQTYANEPRHFAIGSEATRLCLSRYGIQDLIGNIWEQSGDLLQTCGNSNICEFHNALDNDDGARSLAGVRWDGTALPSNPGGEIVLNTSVNSWGVSYLALPVGLPLLNNTVYMDVVDFQSANPFYIKGDFVSTYMASSFKRSIAMGGIRFNKQKAGRFQRSFDIDWDGGAKDGYTGFRCVLPAE